LELRGIPGCRNFHAKMKNILGNQDELGKPSRREILRLYRKPELF
jgi:hypothetical protein